MKAWSLQVLEAVGWSKRQWIFFLIVMSLFAVPIFFALRDQKALTLNDWLILLTGLVVLVYTIETQGLRFEMVRQNEIAVQPVVIMGVQGRPFEHEIILRNMGRGAALFVRIDDVPLGEVAGHLADLRDRVVGNVAKFSPINFIEAGSEIRVEGVCEVLGIGNARWFDFLPSLDPVHAKQNYELTITYEDVNGRSHQTTMRMGKDGVSIISRHKP